MEFVLFLTYCIRFFPEADATFSELETAGACGDERGSLKIEGQVHVVLVFFSARLSPLRQEVYVMVR